MPEKPWEHKPRHSKAALTTEQTAKRYKFGLGVQKMEIADSWWYQNVLWTHLCNSILPTTEQKATEQSLARKGKKGWVSPDSELALHNLRGKKEVLKQRG